MSENTTVKKASKKAVLKSFLNWLSWRTAVTTMSVSRESVSCMPWLPIINDIYDKDDVEGRTEALQRHTAFFNTEPRLGSMIVGLCAAMEERIASGEKELAGEDAMASIKYGLMGPISGIGDTFIQAILSPLLLSMGLGLAIDGNLLGPVLYLVLFIGIILVLGYECYMLGYKKGDEAILNFIESGVIRKIISGAGIMGCTVMGALVANFVSLSTTGFFRNDYRNL